MCALGRGWAGLGVRSSPACINNLLLSPCRDGMCWEIRQRYLPAQARGRFLLKGETAQAGGHGAAGTVGLEPHTTALSRALVPVSSLPVSPLWALKVPQCWLGSAAGWWGTAPGGAAPAPALILTLVHPARGETRPLGGAGGNQG